MPGTPVSITLDASASARERDALAQIFDERGIQSAVGQEELRFGDAITIPWEVAIAAPPAWVALRFATGAAEKAGGDAWDAFRAGRWRGLRELIAKVAEARGRGRSGAITVGEEAGPKVRLTAALPDEALQALGSLDWSTMGHGRLTWDDDEDHWVLRSPNDSSVEPAPVQS